MFVSVTRLHIRRWRFMPGFALFAIRSRGQTRSSPGFLQGVFAREPGLVFWTITVWADQLSMKAFRNSGAHLKVMPRLSHWCDEASYVHWEQDDSSLPTATLAFERLRDAGTLSTLKYPGAAHLRGEKTGKSEPVFAGQYLPLKSGG